MRYMLLIHSAAVAEEFDRLSEDQQKAIYGEYVAISAAPGVVGGDQLQPPETATTVRVEDGKALTTDGPFVETKEALGGYYMIDAPDLDTALAVAKLCPARFGGVEVRPVMTFG